MIETADAPLRTAHAVVPHGQMKGDDGHSVTPEGQGRDPDEMEPPNVERLERMFDEARDLTDRARAKQQQCQDYYDNKQLSGEVIKILYDRKQPPVVDNRIAPAIDGILGVIEGAKVDPRAYPRNPEDQGNADVATKLLRFIADISRWQQTKLDCAEDYLKQGLTAAIVEWDGRQIRVEQIRWETFFYDPKSRKHDFSDAKYLGVAKWMYADEVRQLFPERTRAIGDVCTTRENSADETWEDRPVDQIKWVDKRRNRVLVVEIYYKHGSEWLRCVFCAAGWLEYGKSPYVNVLTGETRCPIEAQSFKVDRENNRYGPIAAMITMQDEVNARRSRGLHLFNNRQVQNVDLNAPPVDADTVRAEMARADGVVPMGWQAVPTNDMAAGNLQLLAEAKDSLSRMVPVALAQDLREGSASSGRARQVAQQAGLTQFGRGFGRLEDFEERIYRQFWLASQQFITDQMAVRITDNPRAPEFLKVNVPIMGQVVQQQPITDPATGQPVIDPATGQPAMQMVPGIGQVGVDKQISAMDMDIIIGTTPDTIALEQEVFDSLMELVRGGVDPFSPQFELLIEMSPLPDKVRILERLKSFREEVQQQQAQAMQQQQEMQARAQQIGEAQAQADIQAKTANAALTDAKTMQTRVETEKSALDGLLANHLEDQQQAA